MTQHFWRHVVGREAGPVAHQKPVDHDDSRELCSLGGPFQPPHSPDAPNRVREQGQHQSSHMGIGALDGSGHAEWFPHSHPLQELPPGSGATVGSRGSPLLKFLPLLSCQTGVIFLWSVSP